jgi:hypothetical protein
MKSQQRAWEGIASIAIRKTERMGTMLIQHTRMDVINEMETASAIIIAGTSMVTRLRVDAGWGMAEMKSIIE